MTSWADRAWFYTKGQEPVMVAHRDGWLRRTKWQVPRRDDTVAIFTSWWLCRRLQWYYGKAKCNGSESNEKLGIYVYTDKIEEMVAFRWRRDGPGELKWNNMGGS